MDDPEEEPDKEDQIRHKRPRGSDQQTVDQLLSDIKSFTQMIVDEQNASTLSKEALATAISNLKQSMDDYSILICTQQLNAQPQYANDESTLSLPTSMLSNSQYANDESTLSLPTSMLSYLKSELNKRPTESTTATYKHDTPATSRSRGCKELIMAQNLKVRSIQCISHTTITIFGFLGRVNAAICFK